MEPDDRNLKNSLHRFLEEDENKGVSFDPAPIVTGIAIGLIALSIVLCLYAMVSFFRFIENHNRVMAAN
jgi:preprotein translocase subunit Sec61beta